MSWLDEEWNKVKTGVTNAFDSLGGWVDNNFPGGWAGVTAATLLAVGITDPSLLSSADEGTLTSTELSNAGVDATSLQSGLTQVADGAAQLGVSPDDYSLLSTTGDPAQAYQAMQEGGFTSAQDYVDATNAGFNNAADYNAATSQGFTSQEAWAEAGSPTSPISPVEPTPVEPTTPPGVPENSISTTLPNGETGYYDSSTGTVYNANGTVNIAQTEQGLGLGNAPGYQVAGPMQVDIGGIPATAENAAGTGFTGEIPQGYQLATNVQASELSDLGGSATTLANGQTAWVVPNGWTVADGLPLSPVVPTEAVGGALSTIPEVSVAAEQAAAVSGLTSSQIAALGGTAAAAALVGSMGTGGAAATANGVIASNGGAGATTSFGGTPSAPTAPTTTAPTAPTAPTTTAPTTTTANEPLKPINTVVNSNVPQSTVAHVEAPTYTDPTGNPVDTSGMSPWQIAGLVAGGYLLASVLSNTGGNAPGGTAWMPIPTYNGAGLVNPGVNPGLIEPQAQYGAQQPGVDSYYWGNQPYTQTTSELGQLNPNAPATPYGNYNAVDLGKLITPSQLNYPSLQGLAAAQGTNNPQLGNFTGLANMNYDIYNNPVQMNTNPVVPGLSSTFNSPNAQQSAIGQGPAAAYGYNLGYAFNPPQLPVTGTPTTPGAKQLMAITPAELSAQLLAEANAQNPTSTTNTG